MKFQYKLPFYKQNIFEVLLLAKAICFVNCEVLLETYTEILIDLYLLPWISYFVFHKTKWKSQTQNTTRCHNHCNHNHYCHYYFRTKKFFKTLSITSLCHDDHYYWMLWKFRIRWNLHETASFIIIRKWNITKSGPGNITWWWHLFLGSLVLRSSISSLLESATSVITKCDNFFYYKGRQLFYYKVRQVL